MHYHRQINRAVDYIEARLDQRLAIGAIAREAGLSVWHFQRIFAAMVGETVGDYITARRMGWAVRELITKDTRVIDIALALNYASHEAFTRAFKRKMGETPSDFRRSNYGTDVIPLKPRITPAYLEHLYEGMTMTPEITTLSGFDVIGVGGSFAPIGSTDPDNLAAIPKLWQQFRERIIGLADSELGERVGVIGAADAPTGRLSYLAGREILSLVPESSGFDVARIPGGEYAKFTHCGSMQHIAHTMNYIFGSWLPNSGRQLGDGPEFGRYPDTYVPTNDNAEMYIYIPLA